MNESAAAIYIDLRNKRVRRYFGDYHERTVDFDLPDSNTTLEDLSKRDFSSQVDRPTWWLERLSLKVEFMGIKVVILTKWRRH